MRFVWYLNIGFSDLINGAKFLKKMLIVVVQHNMLSSDRAAIEMVIEDMRPKSGLCCVKQNSYHLTKR